MSYSRAYGRALRGLRDLHREEFDELLAGELEAVAVEREQDRVDRRPPTRRAPKRIPMDGRRLDGGFTVNVTNSDPPPRVIVVPVEPRMRA